MNERSAAEPGGGTTTDFDPFSPAALDDPYPFYAALRADAPVAFNPDLGVWFVARFQGAEEMIRDKETFSSAFGVDLDNVGADLIPDANINGMDPPRHDVLRDILRPFFIPRSIGGLEDEIRRECQALIEPLRDRDEADLSDELAGPLPLRMISALLGVDAADRPHVSRLASGALARQHYSATPSADEISASDDARRAAEDLIEYFTHALADRRERPREDLITHLATAEVDGDPLGDAALGMCFLLFVAGKDTTHNLLTTSLMHLADRPDDRRRLAADPAALPVAIEEFLRFESPIQNEMRTAIADGVVEGVQIRKGQRIVALFGSANRDERRWEEAEALDLERERRRNLAFGVGIHFCLGAPLARLEARVVLEEFLAAFPDFRRSGPIRRDSRVNERGLRALPVGLS